MKKLRSLIFLIFSTCILAVCIVKFPTILSANSIVLYTSAICGYIGITLLLWMYILGSRTVSRFINKDYSQILRLHNILGKYGLLLVFAHPIFIAISYGERFLYCLVPSTSDEFNIYVTLGRIALYILLAVWISSAVLKSNLKYRPWKYIHLLSYIVIPIFLLHIPKTGSSYSASIATKLYFLFVVFCFIVFTIIRAYSWLGFDKKTYIIKSNKKIRDRIYLISLLPQNSTNSLFDIDDGRYIYIKFNKLFSENHPFSILHFDKKTGEILIVYKVYGRFTTKLAQLHPNTPLQLSGAYGDFLNDINPNDQNIFIAGGIGVTPFIDFISKQPRNSHLIYFNHSANDAIFITELSEILTNKLSIIYSVENNKTILTRDKHAETLIAAINNQSIDLMNAKFYICAHASQVKLFVNTLKKAGVPSGNIQFETFDF